MTGPTDISNDIDYDEIFVHPKDPRDDLEGAITWIHETSIVLQRMLAKLKQLDALGGEFAEDIVAIGLENNQYSTVWTPELLYYDVDDDASYEFAAYDSHGILSIIRDSDTLETFVKVEGSIAFLADPYRVEDGAPESDDIQTGSYVYVPLPVAAYLSAAPYFTGSLSGMFISPGTVGEGVNNFLCGVVGDDGVANLRCRLFYSYTDTATGFNYAKGILPSYLEDNTSFNFTLMYPIGNTDIPGQPDSLSELETWLTEKRNLVTNALTLTGMVTSCIAGVFGSSMGNIALDEANNRIYMVDNNGNTTIRVYSYRDLHHLNESLELVTTVDIEAINVQFSNMDALTSLGDGINYYTFSNSNIVHATLGTAGDWSTVSVSSFATAWTPVPATGTLTFGSRSALQYHNGYLYTGSQRINTVGDIYYFTRGTSDFYMNVENIGTVASPDWRPSQGYLYPEPTAGTRVSEMARHPITGQWWAHCQSSGADTFKTFPFGVAATESIEVSTVAGLTSAAVIRGMQFNETGSLLLILQEDSSGILERAFYVMGMAETLPDLYWPEVSILLDMEDTTTPTDKSGYGHTVALVGTASLSTSEFKFNTQSLSIPNANTQGLSIDPGSGMELEFGTGDFTIEFWFKRASTYAANAYILDFRPASTNGAYITLYFTIAESVRFYTNSADRISGAVTISASVFTHIALCRASGTTRLFINGAQDGADYIDATSYLKGSSIRVGHSNFGSLPSAYGWMDSLRITSGIARYTSDFTPGIHPMPQEGQE